MIVTMRLKSANEDFGAGKGAVTKIILALLGIGLLYQGDTDVSLSTIGIILILSAVLLIVLGKNIHLRTIRHAISTIVRKTWRWKS